MDEYISKEQFVTHFRKLLCEDCNHRKDIKNGKLTNRFVYPIGGVVCRACEIDDMLDRVEDFEPADVAPVKRGKWLPIIEANEYGEAYQCGCYCSECGETLQSEPNYCPNCGADMRSTPMSVTKEDVTDV